MSASVLVKGTLYRQPEERTSRSNKPFVMATIRQTSGADATFWRVFAFSDHVRSELKRLNEGDALTVQGALEAKIYDGGQGPRFSLSVVADHVLALRQPPKQREKKAAAQKPRATAAAQEGFDDAIPF